MASSCHMPPSVKTPHPMIAVPEALEKVLSETAKSLWLQQSRRNDDVSSAALPSHLQLVGRISAVDVKAPNPGYPNHNSSIMDGYAVKTSDLAKARGTYDAMNQQQKENYVLDFTVASKVFAGDDGGKSGHQSDVGFNESNHRTAVYVTTGAVVPTGYDAVIPVEDTDNLFSNDHAQRDDKATRIHIIPSKVSSVLSTTPWTWIRTVGIDIPPESIVLSKGEKIQPVHLALLAQVGIGFDNVKVKRFPRVGVLSTGNELISSTELAPGSQQPHGKIPDVNRPLLLSQLSSYGNCSPVDLGIVSDEDCESIAYKLNDYLWTADGEGIDVIITTGGISMGEKDIMEQVFVQGMGGAVHFGRMNMKPGKPTTFITIDRDTGKGQCKKLVFALPGNPVSASVCTELLVKPCLDLLHDGFNVESSDSSMESFTKRTVDNARVREEVMAAITSDIKLDQGRPEYRRVTLQRVPSNSKDAQYTYHATGTGVQRSSRVLSLRGADGLMMLPRGGKLGCGFDIAQKGMKFPVLLYSSLSSSSELSFKDSMHLNMWKAQQHVHGRSSSKLALGVIICAPKELNDGDDFRSIDTTLINSLGGDSKAAVVHRTICRLPQDEADDQLGTKFSSIVNGPQSEGVNIIFAVVPTHPSTAETGSGAAFKAGLEVSHALRPMLTKNAFALALQVRNCAASRDPLAALFENVCGTVRDGSAVIITCSDRGLEGGIMAVQGSLGHLVSDATSL
ncbi:hypothetical protein ACHAWF_006428 [Thalassiosira exigua]